MGEYEQGCIGTLHSEPDGTEGVGGAVADMFILSPSCAAVMRRASVDLSLASSGMHAAGSAGTMAGCMRACLRVFGSVPMGAPAPEQPSLGLGLGTPSSPLLPYDDESNLKMTPAAVVERLNGFIIGQVLHREPESV